MNITFVYVEWFRRYTTGKTQVKKQLDVFFCYLQYVLTEFLTADRSSTTKYF